MGGDKKKADSLEHFKFRNAKKAFAFSGKPAIDLTDAQWLYILNMSMPESEKEDSATNQERKAKIIKISRPER